MSYSTLEQYDHHDEAMKILSNARKIIKGNIFSKILSDKEARYNRAIDLYRVAANQFKITKRDKEAIVCLTEASEITNTNIFVELMQEIAKLYKKNNLNEKSIESYERIIPILIKQGKFYNLGQIYNIICELHTDIQKQINSLKRAVEMYECANNSGSLCNKLNIQLAELYSRNEEYKLAIELFEQCAIYMIDQPLLKYNAKSIYLKSILCKLCYDDVNETRTLIEKYVNEFVPFCDSRECKLVKDIIDAYEKQNEKEFVDILIDYDSISRLDDKLINHLLLNIKRNMITGKIIL